MKRIICGMGLLVCLTIVAGGAERLEHRTAAGVVYTVTADGLSSIRRGDTAIAAGGWYAWNAGPDWFAEGPKDVLYYRYYAKQVYPKVAADVSEKSLEVLGPRHARVRHVQPHAAATYDYAFDGEDVAIRVRLENLHETADIRVPAFGGLRFVFARPPDGILPVWHMSYLAHAKADAIFHPSHLNRVGGSYAVDGQIGVGLSPGGPTLGRTLFLWDYDGWGADQRDKLPARWLTLLRAEPIPPGGARTFTMTLRVSPNTDWRHLLEPYKRYFCSVLGDRRYTPDHRIVAVAHINRNAESISPANPYGFHGGMRRFDLEKGITEFCDTVIPGLQKANGQGLILWGQSGQHPHGAMYRADFDILPPEVERNWAILAKRFRDAGLELGVCTRPRHMHFQMAWDRDGTCDINPDDPQHLAILTQRFRNMMERGCTLFYLDSFGGVAKDVKIVRHLREQLGPKVRMFAEHACDAILPFTGLYTETDFWGAGSRKGIAEPAYVPRTALGFQAIGRWLLDGEIETITRVYDRKGEIPEGFEPAHRFFFRNHMTPMIADYMVGREAEGLRKLQDEFLAGKGQWRSLVERGARSEAPWGQ